MDRLKFTYFTHKCFYNLLVDFRPNALSILIAQLLAALLLSLKLKFNCRAKVI